MPNRTLVSDNDVVVVSAVRTPFGKFGGVLKDVPSVDLGVHVVKEVLARVGASGELVDEIYYGNAIPVECGSPVAPVVARQVLLKAGLPSRTVSLTIDRACCSSMAAVQLGYRAIKSGDDEVVIAAGAENMGRVPHILYDLRSGKRMGHVRIQDPLWEMGNLGYNPVAVDGGEIALEYGISREEQDAWAYRSQRHYAEALAADRFRDEIVPRRRIRTWPPPALSRFPSFPRPDTTLEKLAKLPTVYGNPTITAGNSPGINAGGSAILLTSGRKAASLGLEPLARIVSTASVCMDWRLIAVVPGPTILEALRRANLSLDEIKLIEINEAFAAMPLVSSKVMAEGDEDKLRAIRDKINVNGGAIAIGHPLGATGARLVMTLIYELRRRGGGYGVAALCGGLAQGDAVVVEAF
ncbi:MAG: thiolase family protein [Chloroflexi bacterium]|nr:thiolase family protein [Chloroflexota bacterium]